ncbi:MAG: hypothetical protein NTX72_02970 [Candidatus Uhrbacteria bacterium]|nr:hypothetical protein [Candidatus Uhrbacteria bacterium]
MAEIRLLPKFLTAEIAKIAVDSVFELVFKNEALIARLKRKECHVVILVPSMFADCDAGYPNWPNYRTDSFCLYEQGFGHEEEWPYPFKDIAQCKALQLWQERNDDRTDVMPHLLFPGDTPFWGGVRRHGIVVTCSGVQPYFDKMISGMIADMCAALAYDAWMQSEDKAEDNNFLS